MRKKGQFSGGMLGTVVMALVIPLIITIMFVVQANFSNAVDTDGWTTAQNTTLTDITGNANDSYDLAGILPIALIGIAILVAILAAVGGLVALRR